MGTSTGITKMIQTPLGAVLILIITLVLAGLTVASAISGALNLSRTPLRDVQTAEKNRTPLSLLNSCFRNFLGQPYKLNIGRAVCHCVNYWNGEHGWKGLKPFQIKGVP